MVHRNDPGDLFGQDPVQRLFGTEHPILQSLTLVDSLLPADHATMFDPKDGTTASGRHALLLGGLDHCEDGQFGFSLDPQLGYRSHEPPFVFSAGWPVQPLNPPGAPRSVWPLYIAIIDSETAGNL
jgi:hypothetical protein